MGCECNYVMLSVCIILFLGVAAQTLAFALPGWVRFTPANNVANFSNPSDIIFKADQSYTSGLWTECEGSLSDCKDWVGDSIDLVKEVGKCTGSNLQALIPGQPKTVCRPYDEIQLAMWVTQAIGLFLIAVALVLAILASFAFCCSVGGCCGDCCVGFCKFIVLLISIMSSMSITCGLVLFGATFAEDDYSKEIYRQGYPIPIKEMSLYYSFALAAVAACLGLIAAIVTAFSRSDDGKV